MIRHHPPLELLMEYATGAAQQGAALVVATHVARCGSCAAEVGRLEAAGGVLLHAAGTGPVGDHLLPALLERLDEPALVPEPEPHFDAETLRLFPAPLRRHLGCNLAELDWRRTTGFFEEVVVGLSSQGEKALLLKLQPGCPVPPHSHIGHELILVLDGGYSDEYGRYNRGDFGTLCPGEVHNPIVDDDNGCFCLVVVDGPVKLLDGTDIISDPSWI